MYANAYYYNEALLSQLHENWQRGSCGAPCTQGFQNVLLKFPENRIEFAQSLEIKDNVAIPGAEQSREGCVIDVRAL